MGDRPVVVVTSRHRPHELLLLLLAVCYGVTYLFQLTPENGVIEQMPRWQVVVWSTGLLVGGTAGVVGTFWRGRSAEVGIWLKAGAMLLGAGAMLFYNYGVWLYIGIQGAFSIGLVSAWMGANLWRAAQLLRDIRRIERPGA